MSGADRTVYGYAPDGGEVARDDRASKWYVEYPGRTTPRRHITIGEAARLLAAGRIMYLPTVGRFAAE